MESKSKNLVKFSRGCIRAVRCCCWCPWIEKHSGARHKNQQQRRESRRPDATSVNFLYVLRLGRLQFSTRRMEKEVGGGGGGIHITRRFGGSAFFSYPNHELWQKKKKGDSNKTECEREREPSKHRHHTPTFLAITSKWNFKILTKNDNRQLFAPSDRHTQFLIYMTINNKNRKKTMRIRAARRRQHKSKRKCSDVIVWRQCRTLRL